MEGLQLGIERAQNGPLGAVMNTARALSAVGAGLTIGGASAGELPLIDSRPPLAMAQPAAAASSQAPININIYPAPGTDPEEIARMVRRELQAVQSKQAARSRSRLTDRD
jgi:hypothetical protein